MPRAQQAKGVCMFVSYFSFVLRGEGRTGKKKKKNNIGTTEYRCNERDGKKQKPKANNAPFRGVAAVRVTLSADLRCSSSGSPLPLSAEHRRL